MPRKEEENKRSAVKNFYLTGRLAGRIDPQLVAGEVHEQLVTRLVFHAHRRITNHTITLNRVAELRKTIAAG